MKKDEKDEKLKPNLACSSRVFLFINEAGTQWPFAAPKTQI